MAYTLNPRHLEIALASGSLMKNGERIELQCLDIGHLVVTSGALTACDPLIYRFPESFADAAVPAASYPVSIAVARFQNGDERVAYARFEHVQSARRVVENGPDRRTGRGRSR
jgi:hypothetical protein